jgi:hypothetical protein
VRQQDRIPGPVRSVDEDHDALLHHIVSCRRPDWLTTAAAHGTRIDTPRQRSIIRAHRRGSTGT